MPGRVCHIAINTDDDDATQAFYEGLFDWRFEPYYPGFVRHSCCPPRPRSSRRSRRGGSCYRVSVPTVPR